MNKKVEAAHYDFDGSQVIDITKHLDFLCGNICKYAARAGRKDGESALDDLLKCQYYVNKKIEVLIDERARQEAIRHDLRCDGDCPTGESCVAPNCPQKAAQAPQIVICEQAGKPVADCGSCIHRVGCAIRKVAENPQKELDGDNIAEYYTNSVPEFIDKIGRKKSCRREA